MPLEMFHLLFIYVGVDKFNENDKFKKIGQNFQDSLSACRSSFKVFVEYCDFARC